MLSIQVCRCTVLWSGQDSLVFVQISFGSYVYPSLLLAYLGQGARLVVNGADVLPNVFYLTIPGKHNGPLFWILYVFAILATLIASQAMITATFSLTQQLVNMRSLPPCARLLFFLLLHAALGPGSQILFSIHMVHKSDKVQGQIYIPVVNWIRECSLPSTEPILKVCI
jgi:KUP system potassium uptake protein